MLIDKFSENWLEQLDQWSTRLPGDSRLYLLLDGVFVPGLHRVIRAALPTETAPQLLFEGLPGCNDDTRDVSPFLFSYSPENLKLRKALLRCDGWPMVHAITTPETHQALCPRLAEWCVVEADGQRFNFRFADTRRLPGIFINLSEEQRAHFVGPVTAWHTIGRDGHWQPMNGLPHAPTTKPLDTRLSSAQFCAMVGDSEADGILTILVDRGRQWQRSHSAVYTVMAQALKTADQLALDDGVRVDWCEACLNDATLLQAPDPLENLQHWLEQNQV
jgi:hypothetical protein